MPRGVGREMLAEFLGTFVLMVFGVGVVAQTGAAEERGRISPRHQHRVGPGGDDGLLRGGAGVTGAHLNPAVTLALAVHRRFAWRRVLPYVGAQMAGAFAASAVVFATYHEALAAFDGGVRQVTGELGTAGIWATYPQAFLSIPGRLHRSGGRHRAARRRASSRLLTPATRRRPPA